MKRALTIVAITGMVMMLSISGCKKPEDKMTSGKDGGLSAVVVFSVGESSIMHADATVEKAALGSVLKAGDKLKTGQKAKVDVQFNDGSSVRLAENSDLDFNKIAMKEGGTSDTQVALVSGKVFAKVNKKQKEDSFSVVTPTAIAGVRGTSFVMEYGKDNKANVKVLEGAVALAPRVQSLENIKEEDILKNPELKKLQAALDKAEVVIEKNQAAGIPADDKVLAQVNNDINLKDTKKIEAAIKVAKKEAPKVQKSELTKNEEQEIKTIVKVEADVAQKMVKLNEEATSGEVDQEKTAEIVKERKVLEEVVTLKQEKAKEAFLTEIAAKPKTLATKKDIVNYYERIEQIIMADGTKIVGAIVDQKGNSMIVHTEKGIQKINQNDVQEVIYDFQTKLKF